MSRKIKIIGVPMDLGQSNRGVDMGPGAVRYAGLKSKLCELGYEIMDTGNIEVPVRESLNEKSVLPAIKRICEAVYTSGRDAVDEGSIPIFLGGDHSIAIGSVGGISDKTETGLLWIDAHGDYNTPGTSASGNIHGMALAVLTGEGIPELVDLGRRGPKIRPENAVTIGVRNLEREERKTLIGRGIHIYTMRDIDEHGVHAVMKDALERIGGLPQIHVSLDADCLDPLTAPGVGTPVSGGLTIREAHLIMETVADTGRLSSMDIVEVNPLLDHANQTARIAVDLAVSLFGKRII
jgi:arginase